MRERALDSYTANQMPDLIGSRLAESGASVEEVLAIAKYLGNLIQDAERYRWMRADGLSFIKWDGLTTETCDVGLDFAIDKRLDATSRTE